MQHNKLLKSIRKVQDVWLFVYLIWVNTDENIVVLFI